jgi:hypothetical protein
MWSCGDPNWPPFNADLTFRICTVPDNHARCAAQSIGSCPDAGCTEDPEVHFYANCHDSVSQPWPYPVTTFVNGLCDLVGPDGAIPPWCGHNPAGSP